MGIFSYRFLRLKLRIHATERENLPQTQYVCVCFTILVCNRMFFYIMPTAIPPKFTENKKKESNPKEESN